LEEKLAYLFPNSKVYLIPLSHKIIVKGQAADAEEAARILQIVRGEVITQEGALITPAAATIDPAAAAGPYGAYGPLSSYIVNMLEVPGEKQIMLHVRIAELNREQLRQMGVDLNVLINNGRHILSTVNGGFPGAVTGIFENGEISVLINWLSSNGMVKFLSAPTLTVLSGHPASFLAGGEFAVPTIVGVDGVGAQQTTFRGFGTSLVVVPTVIDHDLVRMRIIPEFSEVNFNNAVGGIPGVDSRRVHTTVQLREGQTIALAGLYAQRTDTEITRIPWLSDIPFIGSRIFSAKRATQDQTELLVLVTPEIVRPMDAEEVPPLPGYNVTPPGHIQLFKAALGEGPPDLDRYELAPLGHSDGVGRSIGPYQPRVPSVGPVASPYPPMGGYGGGYGVPPVVAPPVQRPPYLHLPPSQGYYPPATDPAPTRPRSQWPASADPVPMPNSYGPRPVPPAEEQAPYPQPQSYRSWPGPSTSSISAPAPTRWTQTLPPINKTVTPAGYDSDGTQDTDRRIRIPLLDRFTRP
ncbi:MAG: type II and III secretion system protein, partial [Planctomycetaceae bacterium]